ncbi:MAG: hypothetical protein H0U74_15910 [Bradymonadaceae bacterium]|nr:hypothetical protein [Lujinxingiaceae bacterium]
MARSRSRAPIVLAILMAWLMLASSQNALAAPPGLSVAAERLGSVRASSKLAAVEATVTLTGDELSEQRFELATSTSDFALRLLWIAIVSPTPIVELRTLGITIDDQDSGVEVAAGELVFRYGSSARLSFSRDLAMLRRLVVEHDGHHWEVTLTGRLEELGLPTIVSLTRDGKTHALVRLSVAVKPAAD